MLTFYYESNGNPISDLEAENYVRTICTEYNETKQDRALHICNEVVIDCLKLMVVEKVIPFEEVQIIFENEIITINELGELSDYPHGFCDVTRHVLHRLIKTKIAIIRSRKDTQSM